MLTSIVWSPYSVPARHDAGTDVLPRSKSPITVTTLFVLGEWLKVEASLSSYKGAITATLAREDELS